jgi:hypothetical protein
MLQAAAPMRGERTLTAVAGASLRRRVSRTFDLLRAASSPRTPTRAGGGFGPPDPGGGGGPNNIDFQSTSVAGVDQAKKSLGAITAGQVSVIVVVAVSIGAGLGRNARLVSTGVKPRGFRRSSRRR